MASHPTDWSEFTEAGYRALARMAAQRFSFISFPVASSSGSHAAPVALWRHDVDFSVHRALRLAEIEAECGVSSTFFFMLRGAFYNLLEPDICDRVRRIRDLGHWTGLHFDDEASRSTSSAPLEDRIEQERVALEKLVDIPVDSVAFHNPSIQGIPSTAEVVAGMANVHSERIERTFRYVSDSNGFWRFDPLLDVLEDPATTRLHVLTHPGWWQPEPMPPRRRVERCVEGRAQRVMATYDDLLATHDRPNLR